jgi:hypothetical protein
MLHRPASRDASPGQDVQRYERHYPEQSLLYQFVEQHYPAFVDQMVAQGATIYTSRSQSLGTGRNQTVSGHPDPVIDATRHRQQMAR